MEMIVEFHRMNIFVEKILMSSVGPSWAGPSGHSKLTERAGSGIKKWPDFEAWYIE
jgi:hypothetical protein